MTSLAFSAAPVPSSVDDRAGPENKKKKPEDEVGSALRKRVLEPRAPELGAPDYGRAEHEHPGGDFQPLPKSPQKGPRRPSAGPPAQADTEPFSAPSHYGAASGRDDLVNEDMQSYYERIVPRLHDGANDSAATSKLDYMIHLLEESRNERTGHMTEELTLYCFLGVFIIFVLDTFSRKP